MQKPPEIQKCDRPTNIPTNWPTDWHCKVLSCVSATKNHHSLVQITLLGSGLKGPMSCRTQGEFRDICPSVLLSVCLSFCPPLWPWKPQLCSLRPDFGPLSPWISPLRPQFSLWELISALQTSYLPSRPQPFRPQIRPPGLKSTLQASNLSSRPKTFFPNLKYALLD